MRFLSPHAIVAWQSAAWQAAVCPVVAVFTHENGLAAASRQVCVASTIARSKSQMPRGFVGGMKGQTVPRKSCVDGW